MRSSPQRKQVPQRQSGAQLPEDSLKVSLLSEEGRHRRDSTIKMISEAPEGILPHSLLSEDGWHSPPSCLVLPFFSLEDLHIFTVLSSLFGFLTTWGRLRLFAAFSGFLLHGCFYGWCRIADDFREPDTYRLFLNRDCGYPALSRTVLA